MARNGISYNDVKQAIDEMQSEGLNPTIAGLRERLGTGSFTTISEHLKRWRSERQQQPMVAGGSPAPDNLNSMVQAVWQQAREDATKELESYKQEIQKTLDQAESEKQEAIEQAVATEERNKWLEDKNQALLEEIRLLEKQAGISEIKIEQCREENELLSLAVDSSKEALNASEKEITDLKKQYAEQTTALETEHKKQTAKLQSDLQSALSLFETQLNEERKRSEASEQHWIKQTDNLRQQVKEKEQRLEVQEKQHLEQMKAAQENNRQIMSLLKQLQESQSLQNASAQANADKLNNLNVLLDNMRKHNQENLEGLAERIDSASLSLNKLQEMQTQQHQAVIERVGKLEDRGSK